MLIDILSLIRALFLAILSVVVVPSLAQAGGRPIARGFLQRPLGGAAASRGLGVVDGALASKGVNVSVSQLAQQIPPRGQAAQGGSCGGSTAPLPAPAAPQPYVPPMPPAPDYDQVAPAVQPVAQPASLQKVWGIVASPTRVPDLVLESVELFKDSTSVAGPVYAVGWRNVGAETSGKCSVAVAASMDGTLTADAPKVVLEANQLPPDATQELVFRLPLCTFNYLIVVVDAFSEVKELDESNNATVIERSALEK